jgi:hypothetical protein
MVYICTTNLISLVLSIVLRNNKIKKLCKIPIVPESTEAYLKKMNQRDKGTENFFTTAIEGFNQRKKSKILRERETFLEMEYKNARISPVVKTFKIPPVQDKQLKLKE